MTRELTVDRDRLWGTLMEMARIGALPNGGCSRPALSAQDKRGRELFVRWCRAAGCEISFDQVGNIFAKRPGRDPARLAVATGSHLDTQPHGGRFDGVFGVLAGLEAVRSLNDAWVATAAPIEVICWTNEEGVRFSPPLTGSQAFAGLIDVAAVHAAETLDGTTVAEDLLSTGFLGEEQPGHHKLESFIEAHIEQGPILEVSGKTIGVVTQIVGIRWSVVTVIGQDAHAGTTPMDRRRDALLGAAHMLTALNEIARSEDAAARLTVGRLQVLPNSGATIPGKVSFVFDLRHPERSTLDSLEQRMRAAIEALAGKHNLEVTVQRTIDVPPLRFSPELVDTIRSTADALGYPNIDMLSGAGHDAMNVARVAPSAMIFVPCKDGLSHNEAESASPDDLAAGAHTLMHALLARAGRAT
jgi:N-carbamoyl-L-amino-acid hydrolase